MSLALSKSKDIITGCILVLCLLMISVPTMAGCPKDTVPGPVTVTMSGRNILRIIHCVPVARHTPSKPVEEVPVPHIKHVTHGRLYKAGAYVLGWLSGLSPEISDSSVVTALARAREFLLERSKDTLFAVFGPDDIMARVVYNETKLPGVIFPKISEAVAMNTNPGFKDERQATDFGNQLTVNSVRTLREVDPGEEGGAAHALPTSISDAQHVIELWAPLQPNERKAGP